MVDNTLPPRRLTTIALLALALMSAPHAGAADTPVIYVGGASGSWAVAGNWSPAVVPNNGVPVPGATYDVRIDGGAAQTSTVIIPAGTNSFAVNRLAISGGDRLRVLSGSALTIAGGGTLENAGTLAVEYGTTWSDLRIGAGGATLRGSGVTSLSSGRIIGDASVPLLRVEDHLIVGSGAIGNDTLNLHNHGTIRGTGTFSLGIALADGDNINAGTMQAAGGTLHVILTSLANTGTIEALGSGTVTLDEGTLTNNGRIRALAGGHIRDDRMFVRNDGGLIEAVSGGSVALTRVRSNIGGVIRAHTGGTVALPADIIQNPLENAGGFLDAAGGTLILTRQLITGGTLTGSSGGLIRLNDTTFRHAVNHGTLAGTLGLESSFINRGTVYVGHGAKVYVDEQTTVLHGGGTVILDGSGEFTVRTTWSLPAPTLVNEDHVIRGSGQIGYGSLRHVDHFATIDSDRPDGAIGIQAQNLTVRPGATVRGSNGGDIELRDIIVVNHGTVEMAPGGRIYLLDSTFTGNGIRNDGSVDISSSRVDVPSITGSGSLVMLLSGSLTVNHVRLARVDSHTSSRLKFNPGATSAAGPSRIGALNFVGTFAGLVDLTDNALVVDYDGTSPIEELTARTRNGYAGGAWQAGNLTSSTAAANAAGPAPDTGIGIADAAALGLSVFLGEDVDATTLLICHTLYGDADLDADVDLRDFNRFAARFGAAGGAYWYTGDFNYDRNVNLQDFNLLAANFGLSAAGATVTPDDWAALASAVPEPGMAGALGGAALLLSSRRRRCAAMT